MPNFKINGDMFAMEIENPTCFMCDNACVNGELTDENDLSYHGVGECQEKFRIIIGSGDGKPMRILFEQWGGKYWGTIGIYEPKFCPNCGRELVEYRKNRCARP